MYCSQCGSETSTSAKFCQRCGTELKRQKNVEIYRASTTPPSKATEITGRKQMSCAGFWKRVAAFFIDQIIVTIGVFVIAFVAGVAMVIVGGGDPDALESMGSALGLILGWFYFAGMESSSNQATLGKMILGIKVLDLKGNKIDFGRASGRYFGKIISSLVFCIGFIMTAFTQKKQGLHDIMAGCLVVNK